MSRLLAGGYSVEQLRLYNWVYEPSFEASGAEGPLLNVAARIAHLYANALGEISLYIVQAREPNLPLSEQLARALDLMGPLGLTIGSTLLGAGVAALLLSRRLNHPSSESTVETA